MLGVSPAVPDDSLVNASAQRYGVYDSVTGKRRVLCGNSLNTGWTSPCGSATESPATITWFPPFVPYKGDTTARCQPAAPASFYLTSKPTWLLTNPFPLIGPDVSSGNVGARNGGTYALGLATSGGQCTGGTLTASTLGGHVNANAAMNCAFAMGMPADGGGPVLAFTSTACPYLFSAAPAPPRRQRHALRALWTRRTRHRSRFLRS